MSTIETQKQGGVLAKARRAWQAPMLSNWLAWLYAPLQPQLKKLFSFIERKGPRGFNPQDILLPDGYEAEVVASGFNAPVHCTFDEEGFCYVVEAGHKVDAVPRILKVDVDSGQWETFFTLPQERWIKTGAMTGAFVPFGSATDPGQVIPGDVRCTGAILRCNPDGSALEVVAWGLRNPYGIAFDPGGASVCHGARDGRAQLPLRYRRSRRPIRNS